MLFRKSEVEELAEKVGEERAKALLRLALSTEKLDELLEQSEVILNNLELVRRKDLPSIVELGEALLDTAKYLKVPPADVLAMAKKHTRLMEITKGAYSVTLAPRKNRFYVMVPDLTTALRIPEGDETKEVMHSSGKFSLAVLVSGELSRIL